MRASVSRSERSVSGFQFPDEELMMDGAGSSSCNMWNSKMVVLSRGLVRCTRSEERPGDGVKQGRLTGPIATGNTNQVKGCKVEFN